MKPKDHQKRIAKKLEKQNGQILYWGLGSGKTYGAINAANELGLNATVITPASLQENFSKEVKGSRSDSNNFDVRSYDKYIRDPKSKFHDMLILDEAHKLRNPDTSRAKKLNAVSRSFGKRVLLTGTPIQDKPSELASLVNIASGEERLPTDAKTFNKMFINSYTDYPTAYARIFENAKPKHVVSLKNKKFLQQQIAGLVDYKDASENLGDYPVVNETSVTVNMTPDQVNSYNFYEQKLPINLRRKLTTLGPLTGTEANKLNAFLSATRQISNTNTRFGRVDATPKVQKVMDAVRKTKGPSLIYSNYLESGVYPIADAMDKEGIPYGLYTGELDSTKKQALVNDYNSGKLKALLVSSSGGEGLDLKNTIAVHILEPHWNNPKLDQVIGRAIRYKSHSALPKKDRNVEVYKYLSKFPDEPTLLSEVGITTARSNRVTADEYLYNVSKNKEKINGLFLNLLKEEGKK